MSDLSKSNLRERYLLALENSEDHKAFIQANSSSLYNLDLTVYTGESSLESTIYNALSESHLDSSISLHPEQLKVINEIVENPGVIFSAPTSFGKTFVMFEYVARHLPDNIFMIVPTLALVDEYKTKIIRKYPNTFSEYKVHTHINEEVKIGKKNIFILTHDRVLEPSAYSLILSLKIDLLVIDEVYKLQRSPNNDRVLVLNVAYYRLVSNSAKHILLAPFIGGIKNIEKLPNRPKFIRTDYSPVVNTVTTYEVHDEENESRFMMVAKIANQLPIEDNRIVYFPAVTGISSFCSREYIDNRREGQQHIAPFIAWIKKEFHKDWYIVKALEKGLLVHNGQIPTGIRMYMLNLFNRKNSSFSTLLSTSTLLEGVNTSAKHVIISKPSRTGEDVFDAFDFFNLVGRSGRMYEHYLGCAHYIKSPTDPVFVKNDAVKVIEFEVTEDTTDIKIHTGNHEESHEYIEFLATLGITHEEYIEHIGSKFRLETVIELYKRYKANFESLISTLELMSEDETRGRSTLIQTLDFIINDRSRRIECYLINKLLDLRRLNISTIVDGAMKDFKNPNVDFIINLTLRMKYSYIEHEFYSKTLIMLYFMACDKVAANSVSVLEDKVKRNIDVLYYANSKTKKMLKDLGISERDIDRITAIIGDDIEDIFALKAILKSGAGLIKLDFISNFIIETL